MIRVIFSLYILRRISRSNNSTRGTTRMSACSFDGRDENDSATTFQQTRRGRRRMTRRIVCVTKTNTRAYHLATVIFSVIKSMYEYCS